MLVTYFKKPLTLERYHSGPAGPHLDGFIDWLEKRGYQQCRIRHLLQGVHHFSLWVQSVGLSLQECDTKALETFRHDLQSQQPLRYPSGSYRPPFVGARHFVTFLEVTGRLAPLKSIQPASSEPQLLIEFRHWMQTHRGTTAATLNNYRLTLIDLLQTLGEEPAQYDAKALRAFILDRASRHGIGKAKNVVTSVRMFLRFLIAIGRCTPGLDHALPTIAHWRLASLPKYLPAETVERVLASCDPTTLIGVRDRAVLLLLARLGLRAGEVAALKWCDIDWHDGTLCVAGKSRRETRLPLPQEVGEAILHYVEHQRPRVPSEHVFLTTMAPIGPIGQKTVTRIAACALRRANVDSPIHGAHVLRHSAATHMLRQGVSLPLIGAVLRHASVETTAIYAKVDLQLLQQVARPWPEVTSC